MSRSTNDEIVQGYIEEVKTYIPLLTEGIEALNKKPDQRSVLEEIHRLVHTIKGASSMVGIYGLSHIACQMEDALDDVLAGKLAFNQKMSRVMSDTIGRFETYCENFLSAGVDSRRMLKETVTAYRRMRGLPADGDQAFLKTLMDVVPEREGGIEDSSSSNLPPRKKEMNGDENGDLDSELLEEELLEEELLEETFEGQPDEDESALMALSESEESMISPPASEPSVSLPQEEEFPEILPELLESFYEEAEEHLQDLGRSLNTLETQIVKRSPITEGQREVIRQIRRSVHTLKGASAVIGLQNISTFAHSVEDLLDWLYETAKEIDPDILSVLTESADILERIVGNPKDPHKIRVEALKERYKNIMREQQEKAAEPPPEPEQDMAVPPPEETSGIFSEPETITDTPAHGTRTLRVGMERVDELVNLMGELIIALSSFDQKMEVFSEAVSELDLSRNRIRDAAREMEVRYEVKALEQIRSTEFDDFDALELDRYSRLNLIIRTLNESVIDVGAINTELANIYSDFDGHLTRQRVLLSELQDKMMRIRMTPMSTITNRLRRTVRDVAGKLGKKIRLIIEGADIELDRLIWEKITDPLMHMLRNAADHGVEPPEMRQAMGKSPIATIKLAASREGNQVVIRITDDGAGLNYDAIRTAARRGKFIDHPEEMSEEDLASLIFLPGFSTRGKISEVSGRGVGMDVVKENIQDLKGSIRLTSWKGKGTRFTVRIPLTLAAVRALLFMVGVRIFAIALNEIREIMRIDMSAITHEIEDVIRIGDEVLPVFYLGKVLNIHKSEETGSSNPIILVVEAGGKRGALVIDSLVGQREIVIKGTGTHLRYIKGVSGVTIMGDGGVVPILNVEELIGSGSLSTEQVDAGEGPTTEKPLEVMIVDDSVSIRQVVSRLMEDQGWRAHTARDGIDALEQLRNIHPDIIVLDIEMPRMNGYEFLRALRAQPAYQHIPVVMLTSRTAARHREKATELGAGGFIVKPYNDDEFIDIVLRLTDRESSKIRVHSLAN